MSLMDSLVVEIMVFGMCDKDGFRQWLTDIRRRKNPLLF